jgi:tryptophan synthase alpha chain
MSRYNHIHTIINQGKSVYMPYVMLGYPTIAASLAVCKTLIEAGVHGLELGMPFRDPMADGPIIQAAANVALDNGFTTDDAISLVTQIRALNPQIPLTLMSYYNMVVARGPEAFISAFAKAGIDGLLVPDLPPELAPEIHPTLQQHHLELILIASPLSDETRLKRISELAGGFIYVITRLGITGVTETYSNKLPELFARIHASTSLPAIAGFGISKPEHAASMVASGANGYIVGSHLVKLTETCVADNNNFTPIHNHTVNMLNYK